MGKVEQYQVELRSRHTWDDYLYSNSGLPGPRSNLELLFAVVREGDREKFLHLTSYAVQEKSGNTPEDFMAACGIVGLGRLVSEGETHQLNELKKWANDSRWRLREAVAMALQEWGVTNLPAMLLEMKQWAGGTLLVRRAAIAALCEPRLLHNEEVVDGVLQVLHVVTKSLVEENDRKASEFKTLRQALGYCWSVAVAHSEPKGRQYMEYWLTRASGDKDLAWVMRENLRKNRLRRIAPDWVDYWLNESGRRHVNESRDY